MYIRLPGTVLVCMCVVDLFVCCSFQVLPELPTEDGV